MFKISVNILLATVILLSLSCDQKQSNCSGFYRKFSFEKNKGIERLDTSISKMKNNAKQYYSVMDVNDSLRLIYFVNDPENAAYAHDKNAERISAYHNADRIIYESDLHSFASGPGKEYVLVNDSVYCKFTLYYFLAPPPDIQHNKSVWIDYIDLSNKEKDAKENRSLITPEDTLDFKKNLTDPGKFYFLLENFAK